MATAARWIRLEAKDERGLRAACDGFARAQSEGAPPAVLWAREIGVAMVVPLKFAPGRSQRWRSWGLAPLIAAFRQAGLRAYLDQDGVWLSGQCIASSEAWPAGGCVVVIASFSADGRFLETLRERIESQHGWQFDHCWPSPAEKEAMLEQADAH